MDPPSVPDTVFAPPRAPRTWRDASVWRTVAQRWRWFAALGFVAVLVAIAVPNLTYARINRNDVSASSSLRGIVNAQREFREASIVDLDGDGVGECGSLRELSGAIVPRGRTHLIQPPVLSGAYRTRDVNGIVHRSGYSFAIFLRGADGAWVPADPPVDAIDPDAMDPDAAETELLCYAWPDRYGATGKVTLVIDAHGTVLATDSRRYSGAAGPPPDAAPIVDGRLERGIGPDTNTWSTWSLPSD